MDRLKELKDIRAIEIIPIDFLSYFLTISGFIIASVVLYYFLTKKKKKPTKQQLATKNLKELDFEKFSDKTIAYQFTLYGYICLQKHYEDEFLKIVRQLEKYKYKKNVDKIDSDLISQMKEYIKVRL